jgi:hypothetical protein
MEKELDKAPSEESGGNDGNHQRVRKKKMKERG